MSSRPQTAHQISSLRSEDVGLTVSEGDTDEETRRTRFALGAEDPHLLRVLHAHSEEPSDDALDAGNNMYGARGNTMNEAEIDGDDGEDDEDDEEDSDTDDSIAEEEEQAIQSELKNRGEDSDSEDEGDVDSESSESSWDDTFLDIFEESSIMPRTSRHVFYDSDRDQELDENGDDDEQEEGLWEYFFSSGSSDEDSPTKKRRNSVGSGRRANSGALYLPVADDAVVPSGDSTDEDDGVPPERKRRRARGTRAVEVLGTNSLSTRPPILGSWSIASSKNNVGIIDGITTRTLSPPPPAQQHHYGLQSHPKILDSGLHSDSENAIDENDDDIGDLGQFLNTEGYSNDEDEYAEEDNTNSAENSKQWYFHQQSGASPHIYRNRPNRPVPLSAFRIGQNQGQLFDMSAVPLAKRSRRRSFGRETFLTPARSRRRLKRVRSGQHHNRSPRENEVPELGTKDLIDELVEIGAISPFFS